MKEKPARPATRRATRAVPKPPPAPSLGPTFLGADASALYSASVTFNRPPTDWRALRNEAPKHLLPAPERVEAFAWVSSPVNADERTERFRHRVSQAGFHVIDVVGAFSFVTDLRDIVEGARLSDAQRSAIRLRVQRADPAIAYTIGQVARSHQIAIVSDSIQIGLILAAAGQKRGGKNYLMAPAGSIPPASLEALRVQVEGAGLLPFFDLVLLDSEVIYPSIARPDRGQAPSGRQMFPDFSE